MARGVAADALQYEALVGQDDARREIVFQQLTLATREHRNNSGKDVISSCLHFLIFFLYLYFSIFFFLPTSLYVA